METTKHTLRRPLNVQHEVLVTVYYGEESMRNIPVGVVKFGAASPQIEIQLAFHHSTASYDEIAHRQISTPRSDTTLAQMAWGLLEKDRYFANGLNIEECLGFQLGVRSGMVGDVIGITRYDGSKPREEKFLMVAGVGFANITKEEAKRLLSTPSESRWAVARELEQGKNRFT